MTDIVKVQDYIKTLEAWPVAGTMELDYVLVARLSAFMKMPLIAMHYKIRALAKFRQVVDKPIPVAWQDVQTFIQRTSNK